MEHFSCFLETSSHLIHDVSGQAHVAQFCVDELSHLLPKVGPHEKFIQRLQESVSELSELSVLYRQFIKDQSPENISAVFMQTHMSCLREISIHYFKDRERLSFEIDPKLIALDSYVFGPELKKALYATYTLFLGVLKRDQVDFSSCRIELLAQSESSCSLLFADDKGLLNEKKIFELCEEDSLFAGKTHRLSNCLESFKKALQGKLEAVKMSFENNDANGLLLDLRVVKKV
jgi:hypothetical protein